VKKNKRIRTNQNQQNQTFSTPPTTNKQNTQQTNNKQTTTTILPPPPYRHARRRRAWWRPCCPTSVQWACASSRIVSFLNLLFANQPAFSNLRENRANRANRANRVNRENMKEQSDTGGSDVKSDVKLLDLRHYDGTYQHGRHVFVLIPISIRF
jgi:hypothetical protein